MKILIVNAGSSSLKYQLIDMQDEKTLAKGLVERIGMNSNGHHEHKVGSEKKLDWEEAPIATHVEACQRMLSALTDKDFGVVASMDEIGAVGHRVLHGGSSFSESVIINQEIKDAIRENIPLGPLHNPATLQGIAACEAVMPNTPMVAAFDTAFHQTMPPKAYMFAVPYKYYEEDRIRRYGFHGTSHKFVGPRAAELAGVDYNHSKIISCHLGSGASICAIKDGKSVDTSMGFTPVEGLVMGTRCGDLDLGALIHIAEKEGMDFKRMTTFINKECGLKGVSGKGVDMRDIRAGKDAGDERSTYAFDMFSYRVKKYIGAYAAAMGGVDVILFTGGIGENAWFQREAICDGLEFLGCTLDKEANKQYAGEDGIISTPDSRVKLVSVTTNEELVIATDTYNLVKA